MKYHIITLGCQMNMSDNERVRAVLDEKLGYQWTDDEKEAQLIGIIACSVRQKAIDKVYSLINKWNKRKDNEVLITFLTGCVLPFDKTRFLKLFDIVFSMSELPKLPEVLGKYGINSPVSYALHQIKIPERIKQFWDISPEYQSDWQAFIPIQNGCDKFCTYCAVPFTRGREISRPSEDILTELKQLVDRNYKSITLLGQNVNSYGRDKKGNEISFAQLLEKVGAYGLESGKDFWVYFTSPHPQDMTDDVLEAIAKYPNLANQIHIPLQAGDDDMLKRMNRSHDMEKYRQIIHSIRRILPTATIFTDIIVGFTDESETEFENTRKAMHEFKFNMAYIAQYSPRPGAKSSKWEDNVPKAVKKERYHQLTEDLMEHAYIYNQNMVGNTYTVIVTGKDRKAGHLTSLTEGRIIVRFKSDNEQLIGSFVKVKITSAAQFSTEGELI